MWIKPFLGLLILINFIGAHAVTVTDQVLVNKGWSLLEDPLAFDRNPGTYRTIWHHQGTNQYINGRDCWLDGSGQCPNGNCHDSEGRKGAVISEETSKTSWYCRVFLDRPVDRKLSCCAFTVPPATTSPQTPDYYEINSDGTINCDGSDDSCPSNHVCSSWNNGFVCGALDTSQENYSGRSEGGWQQALQCKVESDSGVTGGFQPLICSRWIDNGAPGGTPLDSTSAASSQGFAISPQKGCPYTHCKRGSKCCKLQYFAQRKYYVCPSYC